MDPLGAVPEVTELDSAQSIPPDSNARFPTLDPAPAYTVGQPYLFRSFQDANPGVAIDTAPIVWADELQSICQTIPEQWNAYEVVVYNNEGVVYSVKLDHELGTRALITANRFFTRITTQEGADTDEAGEKIARKGNKVQDTHRLKNFRMSMASKRPMLAIMSRRCKKSGIRFPVGMEVCSMERFRTTKMWPEKINGSIMYQMEHEVLNYDRIWWVPSNVRDAQLDTMDDTAQIETHTCSTCK
jgi:hypothetical protein